MQKQLSHEGSDADAATTAVVGHLSPPAAHDKPQHLKMNKARCKALQLYL